MTSQNAIYNAFSRLRSPSSSHVFEALLEIRKFIAKRENNVKVLLEKNVLKELVNILGKPNEKNLDLTLSILGNCCLEYDCRIELFRLGIVKAIAVVLSSASRDAIQGRACRVIGNLALTYNIAAKLHQENVVNSLINVLDVNGVNSIASQHMAVRALRILWTVELERIPMLELNVVRKVALLLTKPSVKKEHKELLKAVIKALTVFTHCCSEQCAVQIHADNSVLQSLISCCTDIETKSCVILCICNLCHIGSSRPILGTAGIVEIIIKELSTVDLHQDDLSESQTALISSLCLLCRESVNRAKIRYSGGLPIILSVLRDSPKTSLQSLALHALVQFVYDEESLLKLLSEGMINVLVTKLNKFISKNGKIHVNNSSDHSRKRHFSTLSPGESSKDNHNAVGQKIDNSCKYTTSKSSSQVPDTNVNSDNWKRFRANSPSYQAVVQEYGCNQSDFCFRANSPDQYATNESFQIGEWSPGSVRSMCFSPESSPPYCKPWNYPSSPLTSSPFDLWSSTSSPVSHGSIDCEIEEVYSPVCQDAQSDDENDSNDNSKTEGELCKYSLDEKQEEFCSDSPYMDDDNQGSNWEKLSVGSSSESQHSLTEESLLLVLISRISHMECVIEDLVFGSTLSTLLDYMRLLQHPLPRAGRILGRIVRTHHYFIHLIIQQFVLNIHREFCSPIHVLCDSCDKLSIIGKNLISKLSVVAETGFGEGELSHHLLKADLSVRETIAVTIPFVIRSPRLLRKLLVDHKGLDVLKNILKEYAEERLLVQYIPSCLSLLAQSLSICNPKSSNMSKYRNSTNSELDTIYEETYNLAISGTSESIAFLLDNGETVMANKAFLSENSPVFEAMLRGNFMESAQKYISLTGISADTFIHLMFIMKLGYIPLYLPSIDLLSSLELLLMLDRFLIPGCEDLTVVIIQQFLQPETACDMYSSANEYSDLLKVFHDIRVKTIEFLLAADMNIVKRKEIFSSLLNASCSSQVQEDIFCLLLKKLERKCVNI